LDSEIIDIFKATGAIREGHFLLTSGLHSPVYWEKFRVLQHPHYTEKLCHLIAQRFANEKAQTVAGPTTGGIIVAFETARQLGIRSIFCEKEGTARAFHRDFSITPGERILVVDDILTTGNSIRETLNAVDKMGGSTIGIGVLVDRSTNKIDFDVPLFSCLHAPTAVYSADKCPLCTAHIPLSRHGELP